MCETLVSKNEELSEAALTYVGGILATDNSHIINILMQNGIFDKLINLLYSSKHKIVKQACWALSNMNACGEHTSQQFIGSSAFQRCLDLCTNPNIDVASEALWAICNSITSSSQYYQREAFIKSKDPDDDSFGYLVDILLEGTTCKNQNLAACCLESLIALLKTDEYFKISCASNSVFVRMHDKDGIKYIEKIVSSNVSNFVFNLAQNLYNIYSYCVDDMNFMQLQDKEVPMMD